jgi:hypothetical protein
VEHPCFNVPIQAPPVRLCKQIPQLRPTRRHGRNRELWLVPQTHDKPIAIDIKGRGLIEGVPEVIVIEDSDICEAKCIETIINAIRVARGRTATKLSTDISDHDVVLMSGGLLIKNLAKNIHEETGLPVSIAHVVNSLTQLPSAEMPSLRVKVTPRLSHPDLPEMLRGQAS